MSLTDNATGGTNTYTAVDRVNITAANYTWSDFYSTAIHGLPTSITITVSTAGAENFISILVDEFSGEGSFHNNAMQSLASPGTGTNAITSGTVEGTAPDIVAACTVNVLSNAVITPGTGYTAVQNSITNAFTTEYLIGAGAGLFTGNSVSDTEWAAGVMTFNTSPVLRREFAYAAWAPTASAPGTTSTSAQVMTGLSGSVTPRRSGRIQITAYGDAFNGTGVADGGILQLRYGTGAPPLSLAVATGTTVGAAQKFVVGTVARRLPFQLNAIVTGLVTGTSYWLDVGQEATTAGTASIENVTLTAVEF